MTREAGTTTSRRRSTAQVYRSGSASRSSRSRHTPKHRDRRCRSSITRNTIMARSSTSSKRTGASDRSANATPLPMTSARCSTTVARPFHRPSDSNRKHRVRRAARSRSVHRCKTTPAVHTISTITRTSSQRGPSTTTSSLGIVPRRKRARRSGLRTASGFCSRTRWRFLQLAVIVRNSG